MADTEKPAVIHQCPPEGSGIMPCCGRTPFERRSDRITVDPKLVTCGKPALYPTKTRLRLAHAIVGGYIRHFPFVTPETRDIATDALVTSRVAELVAAGLAELGEPEAFQQPTHDGGLMVGTHNYSIVSLTPAGEEWLNTYGSTE